MTSRYLVLFISLAFGCAHNPLPEHLYFGADKPLEQKIRGWQLLDYKNFDRGREGYVHYYVPPGRDNLKSWSQLYTQGVIDNPNVQLDSYVDDSTKKYQAVCPGTRHTVIESNTYQIYYLNSYPSCKGNQAQSEITLVTRGPEALYRVSYTVKGRELTSSEKEEWLGIFKKAYIAKGDSHERVR